MLTVAYCRVSTEEQAAEGFSIEGQADRLRAYAELHELGEVLVISDPGLSGKNLKRPGLQQLLGMVEAGHVENVLTWRLDRLSRNLGDLILLADRFGERGVALHSFTEKLDLSSATGRMFYNILGSFAQFYREQLAENVSMGIAQANKQGRWTNRPPTGYDLVDGVLRANEDAVLVRQAFRLRTEGASYRAISERTGINHSTVLSILRNRAYLGLVKLNDQLLPGLHEPLVSEEEFAAAHRGWNKGQRRGRDLMSGRVRCGLCRRTMTVDNNGEGHYAYRCRHRGQGCSLPRRSNHALLRAALLGMNLVREDADLRAAIENALESARGGRPKAALGPDRTALASVDDQKRKLLRLHYDDKISADLFAQEERRLVALEAELLTEVAVSASEAAERADLRQQFQRVASLLSDLDLERLWEEATEGERRILLDELLSEVTVFADHLEVTLRGVPRLNVRFDEVGVNPPGLIAGVGGAIAPLRTRFALR